MIVCRVIYSAWRGIVEAQRSLAICMADGFTINAYNSGNGSLRFYAADETRAYDEARSHCSFLREDPNPHLPERTGIYRARLRPDPIEAFLDIRNEHGSMVERFIGTVEPIGADDLEVT